MRRSDDSRSLGFLFSLAALPLLACPSDDGDATASGDSTGGDDDDADDDDDDSMSASMTEPDPDSSSSGPGTTTDPTSESGPDPTESTGPEPTTSTDSGSESESSSESASTSDSGETESESDTDSGTTGSPAMCTEDVEIPDLCATYEENFIGCYPEYAGYPIAYNCACNLLYAAPNYSGQDCVDAFEDYYACLGTTSCGEIMPECQDEAEALAEPCSS